jgi:hypothetical protein
MSEHAQEATAVDAGSDAALATGAMFGSAAAALAFWAAAAGAGVARQARAYRGPDGRYWVEVDALPERAAALAAAAGGLPFAGHARVWHAASPSGTRMTPRPATPPTAGRVLVTASHDEALLDAAWPEVDVHHLLSASALRPAPLRAQAEILAFVPAALARWVLDRSLARGLETRLAPATWQPIDGDTPGRGGLWISMGMAMAGRTHDDGARVPAAWLRALVDLPGVIVARAPHEAEPRPGPLLCIDVRYRAPVPEPLLARLLPAHAHGAHGAGHAGGAGAAERAEIWLLAGPDIGPGRVTLLGDWVPGSALMVAPALPVTPAPGAGEARLPAPVPVKLVRTSDHAARGLPDAVLVDEQELAWLRTALMAQLPGERVYVLPGMHRMLVLAVAGVVSDLPLGVPLRRVGPGALYLEQGLAFAPPLPEAARAAAFAVSDDEAVAITREGAWRFRVRSMVPAWTLWAGASPRLRLADGEPIDNLRRLADAFAEEAARARRADTRAVARFRLPADIAPVAGAPLSPAERARLREEAAAHALRGELASAAEKLERAGDPAAAARLYERAARQRAEQREEPR